MRSDEIIKSFDSLMKKKQKKRLSGSYEVRAYREEVKRLKEHYQFALSYEKRANQ